MMGTVREIILLLMLQCLVILTGAKTVALFFFFFFNTCHLSGHLLVMNQSSVAAASHWSSNWSYNWTATPTRQHSFSPGSTNLHYSNNLKRLLAFLHHGCG